MVVASGSGAPTASTVPRRQPMVAPHWPAALGARVRVEGHGLGTYVRFDFSWLSRVAHTIDFDEGGERTLTSDVRCRDSWFLRRLCCCGCVAARPVANGWQICDDDDLGSIRVSTLVAPDEPQTIKLAPANMSMCEFRVEVTQRFGVPPEKQQFVIQNDGGDRGDVGNNAASGGRDGELVGEGAGPSTTVWRAGLRSGTRVLLVPMDGPVAEPVGEGEWSVERIVALRRKRLETEKARAEKQVALHDAVLAVGGSIGAAVGAAVLGLIYDGIIGDIGTFGFIGMFVGVVIALDIGVFLGVIGGGVIGAIGYVIGGVIVGGAVACNIGGFVGGFVGVVLSGVIAASLGQALEGGYDLQVPRTRVWGTSSAPP